MSYPWPRGLKHGSATFACWDCGFESCRRNGCPSVVNVVYCLVEVSATGRSLVRRSRTGCGVSEYDIETSTMTRSRPITGHRSRNRTCCLLPSKFQSSFLRFVNKFAVYSVLNLAVIVTTISDSAASSRRLGTSITFQNILCPFARYWRPACVVVQWT
jgi:hypothetical protein